MLGVVPDRRDRRADGAIRLPEPTDCRPVDDVRRLSPLVRGAESRVEVAGVALEEEGMKSVRTATVGPNRIPPSDEAGGNRGRHDVGDAVVCGGGRLDRTRRGNRVQATVVGDGTVAVPGRPSDEKHLRTVSEETDDAIAAHIATTGAETYSVGAPFVSPVSGGFFPRSP